MAASPQSSGAPEDKRLAALKRYSILDTLPEVVFDELTRMAAQSAEAPIASICFVDESRAWYKSRLNFEPQELPRQDSPCSRVIEDRALISIPDTLADPRFKDLSVVQSSPHIRAYYGAPLVTMDGYTVGALALQFTQPTEISPRGLETLRIIARQVMTHLELRRHLVQLSRIFEEQRRAEDALRTSEAFFQALVDSLPQRIIRKDAEGCFTFASTNFCQELKRPLTEICGKTDYDFFPAELADKYLRDDQKVMTTRTPLEGVEEHQRPDGTKGFVQVVKTPLIDVHGQVVGVQGIFWDVTEQRRTEQELAQERDLLRALLYHIPDRLFFKDAKSRFIRCSVSMSSSLNFERPEEVIGRTDFDYYSPELAREYYEEEQRIIQSGQPLINKIQHHLDAKGQPVWSAVTKVPISNHHGEITGIVGLSRDISKLMQTEQALRQAEEKYRNIVENSVEGFFQTTPAGHYLSANRALARLYGYSSAGELMQAMTDIQHQLYVDPNRREEFRRLMREKGEVTGFESQIHRKSGDIIWISESARSVCNEKGDLIYYEGSVEDITARKLADQAKESAHESALESARVKAQFLANMSHEFRTPLNAIIGNASVLLSGRVNEEQRELLEPIVDSAEALNRLINDILDFSKMEAGKLTFEKIDFDFHDLVEGTAEMLAQNARNQGNELVCWLAPDVPRYLQGDPVRIRQVLMNLLSNAIKFTKRGEVSVRVSVEQERMAKIRLRLEVQDTGVGIDAKSKPIIFQAFTQADGSTTRKYGGTGLGLTISKQIVEMMDGTIGFDSEAGKGSTFWFTLNLPIATTTPPTHNPWLNPSALGGKRVWVIDDHLPTRQAIANYLNSSGIIVEASGTSQETVRRLQNDARIGRPWDILLVDAEMPELDGLSLVRLLRENEANPLDSLRIIMLTAPGFGIEPNIMQALGISGCLSKPAKRSRLLEIVSAALKNTTPSLTDPTQPSLPTHVIQPIPGAAHIRLLVAEDNPVNQQVARRMLKMLGFNSHTASHGHEVLDLLRQEVFDIILMDCQMPELDGYATSRAIREDLNLSQPQLKCHPFLIAVTANAMAGDREKCLAAGMHEYLSKPLKLADLATVLQRAVHCVDAPMSRSSHGATHSASPSSQTLNHPDSTAPSALSHSSSSPTPLPAPTIPHDTGENSLDTSVIQGLRDLREPGQPDPLRQLVDLFIRDSKPRVDALERALKAGDLAAAVASSHSIKGSASNLGAKRLASLASQTEKHAKAGDATAANRLLEPLIGEFQYVQTLLQAEVER